MISALRRRTYFFRAARCVVAGSLRLTLILLMFAAGTAAANALPGVARTVDPTAPNSPSGEVEMLDRSAIPSITWKMADDVPVWKSVHLGTFTSVNMLREALDSEDCGASERKVAERPRFVRAAASRPGSVPGCHLGDSASEIIGRPAFRLSRIKQELDLVAVSLIDLGFAPDEDVMLEDIYARAELLNYTLCPAEVGPYLRLQYLDQPAGEFLHVAMEPITTYAGEPTDLTVANGGAGLVLLGGDDRPNLLLPAVTRFVFVRPRAGSSH
jgi:hypothetical protein